MTHAHNSVSRIARSLTPRRVLPLAVLFVIADLAITVALLGLAVESNPIAAWLFETIGTTSTGILAVLLVTLAYVGLGRDELDRYDRSRRLVSGGLLATLAAPLVWNTAIWVRLGTPDVAVAGVVETIAPVAVAGVVAVLATSVDVGDVPRPEREEVVSVVFSVIMVTSMIGGVAFVGTQPFSEDRDGVVKAESTDSDIVYSGADDNTVKALDASTGDEIWTSDAHSDTVRSVAPDGGVVYSGADDNTVKALDASTGDEIWTSTEHSAPVRSVAPDGGVVYSGSQDNTVKALDAETGEEIWTNTEHSDIVYSVAPDGGVVYSGSQDNTVQALDASTGDEIWTSTEHSDTVPTVATDGDVVYSGANDNTVKALDASTGDEIWTSTAHSDAVYSVATDGDVVYSGAFDNTVKALDASTGDEIWTSGAHSDSVPAVAPDGGVVYSGSWDETVKALDASTGDEIWTSTEHSANVWSVAPDGGGEENAASWVPEWEDQAPLLRAVDQNGDPVHNASIEAWSVDLEELSDEVEDKEARAEEIRDELDDVQPDRWEPPTQVDLSYGDLTDLYGGEQPTSLYPTAHTKGDMGIAGWADTHDLRPRLEFNSGETVYLYAWDGSEGANMGLTDDGVTSEHYGEIADDPTFTLERIGATGETLDTYTINSTDSETYTGGVGPASYEHDYATANLPDGYYLVSVEGSAEPGYIIKVGEASSVLTTELRDEADELTEQAENLESYLGEDTLTKDRVNATRYLSKYDHENLYPDPGVDTDEFDYGWGYVNPGLSETGTDINDLQTNRNRYFPEISGSEIFLQGYRGPDVGVDDYEEQNVDDILLAAAEADEPIYASTEPKRIDLREIDDPDNATIEVELRKFPAGLDPEAEKWDDLRQSDAEELLNETSSDLEDLYRDDVVTEDELEERHEEIERLIDNNEDLEERVEELLDRERNGETEEELRDELDAMETAIADLEEKLESGDPGSEIEDGEIFAQFPFAGDLDADAVTVMAHYEDGSSEVVDREYWSVESASVLGGDEVAIDGYPVSSDRAVADLEVRGVSDDGDVGSSRDSVRNPLFSGDVPDVDGVDVSTIRPGVGDTVAMEPRSDDSAYNGTTGATVYDPDGNEVEVDEQMDRVSWTPETAGAHTVRLRYDNQIGHEFVETFKISVKESTTSTPPSLRVTEGIGGPIVLAGDGLESGSVDVVDDTAEITAVAPGGETPSSVNVWAESLTAETIDVRVVQGDYERSVDRHVSLSIRTNADIEDAIVRRSGNALTADGDTKHGEYQERTDDAGNTVTVIETYTDSAGVAEIEINNDPSLIERILVEIETSSPISLMLGVPSETPDLLSTSELSLSPMVNEATPGEVVFSTEVGA